MTVEELATHRVEYHHWTMDRHAHGYLQDIAEAQARVREVLRDLGIENEDWFLVGGEHGVQWVYFTDPRVATLFKLSWVMDA